MMRHKIAIGIIKNTSGQILLAKRPSGKHLSGCWEFPGGKVESTESFKLALRRELNEEIAIDVEGVKKILEYQYQYSDRVLHFQVFEVLTYSKSISARELQTLQWADASNIGNLNIPPANTAILNAVLNPDFYMIACNSTYKDNLRAKVEEQLQAGITIVQFRAPELNKSQYISKAIMLRNLCEAYNAKLISNCELSWVDEIEPHGIHLTSARLNEVSNSNHGRVYYSASCHNQQEVELANHLHINSILIGAVQYTRSHPNNSVLGWVNFQRLCNMANCPVYALGGLTKDDLMTAKVCGAQGIAGIRLFQN